MKIYSFILAGCLLLHAGVAMAVEKVVSTYTETSAAYTINVSWQRFGIPQLDKGSDDFVVSSVSDFRKNAQKTNADGELPYEMNLQGGIESNGATVSMVWDYSDYTGGAHGFIGRTTQNYKLPEGRPFTLANVFPHKEKALKIISELVRKKLIAQDLPEDWVARGTEPEEENFSTFILGSNGITFIFNPYQVGAFADGIVTVSLSLRELSEAKPDMRFWR